VLLPHLAVALQRGIVVGFELGASQRGRLSSQRPEDRP
jgi:hypothetical protein